MSERFGYFWNVIHYIVRKWRTSSFQFVRLFTKLPRPGDSEMTFAVFESGCHLLLPV